VVPDGQRIVFASLREPPNLQKMANGSGRKFTQITVGETPIVGHDGASSLWRDPKTRWDLWVYRSRS
jgi:hypothetical protein